MGRGRQKAKQTKVARELKYSGPNTDFQALQRELGTANPGSPRYTEPQPSEASDDEDDPYDDWVRRSS